MAKKKIKKGKNAESMESQNILPQNMVFIGEPAEGNKKIYISQNTYKTIQRFTKDKTENESGGVLFGRVIEEFGKTNIVISSFIEAKYAEGTATTLKFTHETWDFIHKEADKKDNSLKIVGWIHTHPNFGIFLSEYDVFIQDNFFSEENQVAYVVDPIQKIEGFYYRIDGKLERCKGFYIYDKIGAKIKINEPKDEKTIPQSSSVSLTFKILFGCLAFITVVLAVACISLRSRIGNLVEVQKNMQLEISELVRDIHSVETKNRQQDNDISTLGQDVKTLLPPEEDIDSQENVPTDSQKDNAPNSEEDVGPVSTPKIGGKSGNTSTQNKNMSA